MNALSWILAAGIAVWLVLAIAHMIKNRGGCSCGGGSGCSGCNQCSGNCECCKHKCEKDSR